MSTAAILLAAGASTRLGHPKQLADLYGERLLDRAVRMATEAGCTPVLVILGANAEEIQQTCDLAGSEVVLNQEWQEGMASSVRSGIRALPKGADSPAGVVLMTCDQPAVTPAHLCDIIRMGRELEAPVASRYGAPERHGVPAYFPHTLFPELLLLQGDTGARSLLASAKSVFLNLGEVDIDTPAALAQARALFR